MTAGATPVALYVHVPFCRSRCAYCDFTSSTDADVPGRVDAFCSAVERAVGHYAEVGLLQRVPSVYFGGGTPTVLGEQLPALVATVLDHTVLDAGAEITVEANPESLDELLLSDLIDSGVNRASLGVQSFDDEMLRLLGRCHSAPDAERACSLLARSGVSFSADLICGIPGLSEATWRDTLARAVESGAGHLSVYPLSIEEGTGLARRIDAGELVEPDPDDAAAQMLVAEQVLTSAGFERYEVASYARPGRRARHNTGYWTGTPYLGVGPGAASMLPTDLAGVAFVSALAGAGAGDALPPGSRARFVLHDTLDAFLDAEPDAEPHCLELLTAEQAVREDAMLGLRLSEGITRDLAERAGVTEVLGELADEELVEQCGMRWRVTQRGWLLGNEVFGRVLG